MPRKTAKTAAVCEPKIVKVVPVAEYEQRLPLLSGREQARFDTIWQRVQSISRRYQLHDLDTARLLKRFMDEPKVIAAWIYGDICGLINRHFGRKAGDKFDADHDRITLEFKAVVPAMSPLNLDAAERLAQDGITLDDLESMMADLYTFTAPQWRQLTAAELNELTAGRKYSRRAGAQG